MDDGVFDSLASAYDRLRPADEAWLELAEAIWAVGDLAGRRTLDVGCGTGQLAGWLAARGAKVWGVDPSEAMLEQARGRVGRAVGLKQGSAEHLPFRDGWFDRAVLRLVLHLVDRQQALGELARVLAPGGRLVIATFRPEHFERVWLARLFPSLVAIDRARFPDPASLAGELEAAGFRLLHVEALTQEVRLSRADALERLRERHISTLWLLPSEEYEMGLARAERELPGDVESSLEWALLTARTA